MVVAWASDMKGVFLNPWLAVGGGFADLVGSAGAFCGPGETSVSQATLPWDSRSLSMTHMRRATDVV